MNWFTIGIIRAGLWSRAFSLSAITVNRMRQENADARQNKNSCCNIQHRTGPEAHPMLEVCIVRVVGDRLRPSSPRKVRCLGFPEKHLGRKAAGCEAVVHHSKVAKSAQLN